MTNNINGIDVSEEIRYCNNCSNLGLDFKTGKLYCGLSNRKDELPEILSCENFSSSCYIKRLQQELDIKEKMLDKFMIGSGETLEKLQKENENLKEQLNIYMSQYEIKIPNKYRQALEKIIDIAEKLITETPEYNSCYYKDECGNNCTPKKQSKVEYCCYENVDKILTIINEVLNDRD